MKKLTGFLVFIFVCNTVLAQNDSVAFKPVYIVKTNPLNYFTINEINISYERLISGKSGYEISFAWNYTDVYLISNSGLGPELMFLCECRKVLPSKGVSLQLGYRSYFNKKKKAPLGGYFSPQLMLKFNTATVYGYGFDPEACNRDIKINKNIVGAKALWGHQSNISGKIFIEYYAGVGISMNFQRENTLRQSSFDYETGEMTEEYFKKNVTYYYILSPTVHLGLKLGFLFE